MEIDKINIPKISVIIITYNQENLIGRAIESILREKDYIYEIIISDDCSKDNNWKIISHYVKKYPQIVRAYRNKYNLGIFKNMERSWEYPTGDIIYELSGDDEVGKDWFKKSVEFIFKNKVDYKNELFCIYGDSKCIYPSGDSITIRNNAILKGHKPLKLFLRGLITKRSTCFSNRILKKFRKVSKGRSYVVENAQDSQLHLFVEKAYYLPYVGNIYHTNVGVSNNMDEMRQKEHEQTMVYAFNFFNELGYELDRYDKKLIDYNISFKRMVKKKSLKSIFRFIFSYVKSYDPNIGLADFHFKKFIFLILRKIPHKNPMHW